VREGRRGILDQKEGSWSIRCSFGKRRVLDVRSGCEGFLNWDERANHSFTWIGTPSPSGKRPSVRKEYLGSCIDNSGASSKKQVRGGKCDPGRTSPCRSLQYRNEVEKTERSRREGNQMAETCELFSLEIKHFSGGEAMRGSRGGRGN